MDAPSALALLRSRGLSARVLAGRLRVGPADRLDDELRDLVRQHRAELVALLSDPSRPPAPRPRLTGPDPPGRFGRFKTVAAADYFESVRAGAAHNAAVLARGSSTESRPRKASTEEPAPTFEEIA